jgi:hypothetical protein
MALPSGVPSTATKSANRKYYEGHTQNLRALDRGIRAVERLAKSALRSNDAAGYETLLPVLAMLNGVWVENRLRKLIYERGPLNDSARRDILTVGIGRNAKSRPQEQRWRKALDHALLLRYGVSKPRNLPSDAATLREDFLQAVSKSLVPLIDERNSWAHGGWAVALDRDTPSLVSRGLADDYVTLRLRRKMGARLAEFLQDLLVFQRSAAKEAELRRRAANHLAAIRALESTIAAHDPAHATRLLSVRAVH